MKEDNLKKITVRLPHEDWAILKKYCVDLDRPMNEIIVEQIRKLTQKKEKK